MSSLLREAEELEERAAGERLEFFRRAIGRIEPGAQLLDLGCGNGYGVSRWRDGGIRACGVDLSFYRLSRWPAVHAARRPFVVADAAALPFRDGTFAAVLSSGMLEHVGVEEASAPYRIRALPERDALRERVIREMLRVSAPGAAVVVDFPNGLFPVDFWHGDRIGAFRLHAMPDVLLPSFRDVSKWCRHSGARARLLPLGGRFRFRQVGRRWWGRALAPLARLGIAILDGLAALGLSPLVAVLLPYLVIRLEPAPTHTSSPRS